mmetsp:Transcript_170781/g.542651  ORF Transcript_170781/g.542651 Transcript_170781/m.542651 type:complete len:289 (+) Transcript_170781:612-1478(+)
MAPRAAAVPAGAARCLARHPAAGRVCRSPRWRTTTIGSSQLRRCTRLAALGLRPPAEWWPARGRLWRASGACPRTRVRLHGRPRRHATTAIASSAPCPGARRQGVREEAAALRWVRLSAVPASTPWRLRRPPGARAWVHRARRPAASAASATAVGAASAATAATAAAPRTPRPRAWAAPRPSRPRCWRPCRGRRPWRRASASTRASRSSPSKSGARRAGSWTKRGPSRAAWTGASRFPRRGPSTLCPPWGHSCPRAATSRLIRCRPRRQQAHASRQSARTTSYPAPCP